MYVGLYAFLENYIPPCIHTGVLTIILLVCALLFMDAMVHVQVGSTLI